MAGVTENVLLESEVEKRNVSPQAIFNKKKKKMFLRPSSSVSNAPHLSFFKSLIKKSGLIYFIHMPK